MAPTRDIGCLLIDDPVYDIDGLGALADALERRGVRTERFRWDGTGRLHMALQRAYQRVRRDDAVSGIVARGGGCDCALALACQLPSERLVLLYPDDRPGVGEATRQLRRIRAFARRNAAFCVSEVLIVPGISLREDASRRLRRCLTAARVSLVGSAGETRPEGGEVLSLSIFHFLRDGVLPKNLAENPEMCIIYG